jgi:hypothetical protein
MVYDVSAEPFRWGNAGEGLVALAIVALGIAAALALRRRARGGVVAALAVALLGAGVYVERTVRHRREHEGCVQAVVRSEGRLVEGVIRDYRPAATAWQKPAYGSFVVGDEKVTYPLLAEGCGFHQSAAEEGAVLREGARVRLRVWDGQIVKLEVQP